MHERDCANCDEWDVVGAYEDCGFLCRSCAEGREGGPLVLAGAGLWTWWEVA